VSGGSPSGSLGTAVSGRKLTRRFGRNVALDDEQFEVRAGELHALLGPNALPPR
jgi:ABC-type branched-subunit amino acid transport system ATPase component